MRSETGGRPSTIPSTLGFLPSLFEMRPGKLVSDALFFCLTQETAASASFYRGIRTIQGIPEAATFSIDLWNLPVSAVMSIEAQSRKEMPDEVLIANFQKNGDPECYDELFTRYRRQVYFACKGFFGEASAAEDATQETFLRAYQNIHRFSGGNFGGWLMRIARNICIDTWRSARAETPLEEPAAQSLPSGASLEEASEMRLALQSVLEAMETLPSEQQRCVELKMEGYSYEETAAVTGFTVQAVKSHLQNGRRNLWLRMKGTLSQLK